MQPDALETGRLQGPPSPYTCPECGGTLWESQTGRLSTFNCHTGHGFTAESLLAAQNGALEEALWSALRALEEHAALPVTYGRACAAWRPERSRGAV